MAEVAEKGTISIHTENIFPIIKKFLYSDHEIFLRELVSTAVDATQKLKKLASLGEFNGELGQLQVTVSFDKAAKTITVSDRGLGMTGEEIKKYINQIAFSGATEFVEKFKDKGDVKDIIGKFGLGFYSAFMVAEKVEIISRSFKAAGNEAVKWECDGSTEFELTPATRGDRGTDVILHINADSEEFLEEFRLKGILEKYCKFLPVEIKFGEKIINNPSPLWTKSPGELTDEDYKNFYKELYPFAEEPLFWIHLNVDYPFNLTGILYFPKVKNDFEVNKNKIQLYSRQVFITDEVKDVVPDFLMLLHGVLDSPDIPLNVSRSYLQSDSNVKKISQHITKKVADKLQEMFRKDRPDFEKKWDDIAIFVKYGMISDEKFYDRAKEFALLKNTAGKYFTFEEYKNHVKDLQTDKEGTTVYIYTTDQGKQHSFIESALAKAYDVLVFDGVIDPHFVNALEPKLEKVQFKRVDSETVDKLVPKDEDVASVLSKEEEEKLKTIFEKAVNNKAMMLSITSLSPDQMPVIITMSEWMRRMKDMAKTGGGGMAFMGSMPDSYNVSINGNHSVIQKILKAEGEEKPVTLAKQAYDLALLSQNMLTGADLTNFIKRSVDLVS
ncbi:MAG TPA: molecular chaperone HtpG [Cyclobacteriaceae bacterium]